MISTHSQLEIQYHPHEYDEPLSMRSGSMKKLLEFDISDLNSEKLPLYRRRLTQLAEFARLSRIQISFTGLNDYINKSELHYCRTWNSKDILHPEREIVELMIDIQTKSLLSHRKYDIDLVF